MPDVNSFCVRCLDNHCCTAGCQKLAGWPSVCKIKPRSSSDVFLCLLLTVILAEEKDLLYGLLCLQGIRWLSTCEMSVEMVFKERSTFWNFLCWMHAAKSFQPVLQETSRSSHCSEACLGPSCKMPDAGCGFSTRTVWLFLAMFPFFCLACCLIGIAPWHSGFAHWLWKCLRLCPDVLHSQELWAQILDPESCQQLATDTHFSCLIWPTCTWNATSCSRLCISTISTVESLNCFADILQAVCDRGHHALQLFPSISFHFLAGLTCLMPVSLTPSTALTDILMQLSWLLGDLCCSTFALHKRFWVRSDHGSDESYEEASFVETTQKETWQSCPEMFRSPCTLLFWNSILGFHRKSTGTLSLPDVLLPKLKKYKTLSKQRRLSWIDSGVSQ